MTQPQVMSRLRSAGHLLCVVYDFQHCNCQNLLLNQLRATDDRVWCRVSWGGSGESRVSVNDKLHSSAVHYKSAHKEWWCLWCKNVFITSHCARFMSDHLTLSLYLRKIMKSCLPKDPKNNLQCHIASYYWAFNSMRQLIDTQDYDNLWWGNLKKYIKLLILISHYECLVGLNNHVAIVLTDTSFVIW